MFSYVVYVLICFRMWCTFSYVFVCIRISCMFSYDEYVCVSVMLSTGLRLVLNNAENLDTLTDEVSSYKCTNPARHKRFFPTPAWLKKNRIRYTVVSIRCASFCTIS